MFHLYKAEALKFKAILGYNGRLYSREGGNTLLVEMFILVWCELEEFETVSLCSSDCPEIGCLDLPASAI